MYRSLRFFGILIALFLSLPFVTPAQAQSQTPEFRLDVNRDFGFGNGSNVRGNFSLRIYGDEAAIQSVTYLIDGEAMATLSKPPFRHQFKTGQYPAGQHQLTAVVKTTDGRSVTTPPVRLNFLSAGQESDAMKRIFVPVFGGVIALTVVGVVFQMLVLRGDKSRLEPGAPRHYGIKGGTICPRCNRPYARHLWGINLGIGALDRCDFCGKWAVVRRYDPAVLAAAEEAERAALRSAESAPITIGSAAPLSEEGQVRKAIEESKYLDN